MGQLERREFVGVLGAAALAGFGFGRAGDAQAASPYDLPPAFKGPGSVSLLHLTDCHAQLLPLYFREPSVNLGVAGMSARLPHLVGRHLARAARLAPHADWGRQRSHPRQRPAARRGGRAPLRAPARSGPDRALRGAPAHVVSSRSTPASRVSCQIRLNSAALRAAVALVLLISMAF